MSYERLYTAIVLSSISTTGGYHTRGRSTAVRSTHREIAGFLSPFESRIVA